eukprot:gene24701-5994_t
MTLVWVIARSLEDGLSFGLWGAVPLAQRYEPFLPPATGRSLGLSIL